MKHTQSYILCATPRSGSTLLCDLLTDTGVAGQPQSFFRFEDLTWYADRLNVLTENWANERAFDQAYLDAVLVEGTGKTQVFGLCLMWESLSDLTERLQVFFPGRTGDDALFQSAFGPPLYIHLSRNDKVAQAVSHLRAEQSGLWHRAADGSERERLKPAETPVYDSRALSELVAESEEHDAAWNNWFEQHDVQPLRVTYEALSENPQTQLARILSALGQNPAIADSVKPRTAKLADKESHEWAERFQRE